MGLICLPFYRQLHVPHSNSLPKRKPHNSSVVHATLQMLRMHIGFVTLQFPLLSTHGWLEGLEDSLARPPDDEVFLPDPLEDMVVLEDERFSEEDWLEELLW